MGKPKTTYKSEVNGDPVEWDMQRKAMIHVTADVLLDSMAYFLSPEKEKSKYMPAHRFELPLPYVVCAVHYDHNFHRFNIIISSPLLDSVNQGDVIPDLPWHILSVFPCGEPKISDPS